MDNGLLGAEDNRTVSSSESRPQACPASYPSEISCGAPVESKTCLTDLLRGYPIGALLSWTVEPSTASNFKFYECMRR